MARQSQAAAALEAERAERELNTDINEAIARTDSEVFTDALGDEPLSEDADTSLEEMGEGLEGEQLDEEEGEDAADEAEPPEQRASESEEDEGEGERGDEADEEAPSRDERGRFEQREPRGGIPPRVVRDLGNRARTAEGEAEDLRAQLRDMQVRFDNLTLQLARPPQPQPARTEPKPKPDMFTDPAAYEAWVIEQAEAKASARIDERLGAFQRDQQQETQQRINENLNAASRGPRGYEFNRAYDDLTSLPRTAENAALVRRLTLSADPAKAILDWWEQDSNPEYIEYVRNQIRQAYEPPQQRQRGFDRGPSGGRQQQPQQQPRREYRLPSLSSASGTRSQHVSDPEMSDGSEASVFRYGAGR